MMLVSKYLPLPRQVGEEFWDIERIEHIRRLATTGKPYEIRVDRRDSLRILDRIVIKELPENLDPKEDVDASTYTEISGIPMSSPIYLGDMSYGALSGIPNAAIAMAADAMGILAGTGEGGLHPDVAKYKRIFVQWASARFGVDINVLMRGMGVVIKIGQGAKPGIGGHLPGSKVTELISLTRRIPVGSDAISPAPHHDIYSIEDLGQRIEALKEATGKPVYVKVAATNYVPYIVTGIARMGANGVIIDGHGAGTGATPIMVRDNLGIPIELAVASAHDMLVRNGLREDFYIIAGGRVSNALDAAKLIALGADAVNIGTAALIAMGCIMIHKCHIGNCPAALTNLHHIMIYTR
jgi:glutamate synthase domain-containing protein 2